MLRFFLTYRGVRVESKQNGKYVPAENWKDIEQIFKRSSKYAGITYLVSSELTFTGPFVNILDQIKENGLGEDSILEIWKKNQISNAWEIKFTGIVDVLGSKKTLSTTGLESYTVNISPLGFERDFDNNFDVDVNITNDLDLSGNIMIPFQREFDWIKLKPLSILQNLHVESEVPNNNDAGSSLTFDDNRNYYFFVSVNHSKEIRQEYEDVYQNNPTLLYTDYGYTGPDPWNPFNHEDVLEAAPHSPTNNQLYLLKAKIAGEYSITWEWNYDFRIDGVASQEQTIKYVYWVLLVKVNRDDPLNPVYTVDEVSTQNNPSVNNSLLEFSSSGFQTKNYNLVAGEEIYLIPYFSLYPRHTGIFTTMSYNELLFTVNIDTVIVESETKFETTSSSAYLAHELFSRLTNKLTGVFNAFKSTFYGRTDSQPIAYPADGEGSLTAVTGGEHIRGWQIGNDAGERSLNLSFKDFFESEKAKHNINLGIINNKVIIEELEYFFDSQNFSTDLGIIRDIEIETETKLFFNSVSVGYSEWKNAEKKNAAGRQEFNSRKTYTTQFNGINKKYNAVSKFTAAGYTIETTRSEQKNLDGEKETQNDNKKFMVALQRRSVTIENADENNPAFENETYKAGDPLNPWLGISGVDKPEEIYNVRWQPARVIRKHGNIIRLSTKQTINDTLLTQAVEGNKSFASQLKTESNPISEGGNISGAELGDNLFTGFKYIFEIGLSDSQIESILNNPYYYIKFKDVKGNQYKGVIPMGEQITINIESNLASFNLIGIK